MRVFSRDAGLKVILFRPGNADTGQAYGGKYGSKTANPTPPFDLEV